MGACTELLGAREDRLVDGAGALTSCAARLVVVLGTIVALGDEGFDTGFLPVLLVIFSVWVERGDLPAFSPDPVAEALDTGTTALLVSTADGRTRGECVFELFGTGLPAPFGTLA